MFFSEYSLDSSLLEHLLKKDVSKNQYFIHNIFHNRIC